MAHWIQLAGAISTVVLLLGAIWGIGGCLHPWLREEAGLRESEYVAFRFLGGAGLLSLVAFLVGLLHFSRSSSVALFLAATLLNVRFRWRPRQAPQFTPALWYALAIASVCVVSGFAAPIGNTDEDEISYHLLEGHVWHRNERISPLPEEALSAFPATIEVLYAMATTLSNDCAPGAFGVFFFVALILQVRGLTRHLGGSALDGDLAAAFIAGMPAVTSTIEHCFVDIPYAAFILASARLVLSHTRTSSMILAGMFAGFSAGTKYFGLPATLLVAAVAFLFDASRAPSRCRLAFVFLVSAGLAGGSWYLRNWIVLGNPVYPPPPLLWRWFPTPSFSLEASIQFKNLIVTRGAGLGKSFRDLLLLPFRLTYWTAWFHGGGGIGLAPLAFGPIALALVARRRVPLAWAMLAGLLTVFWFYSDQEFRFLGPATAIIASFAGLGAGVVFSQRDRLVRAAALGVIGISLGFGIVLAVRERVNRIHAVCSPRYAEARLEQGTPYLAAFAYLNSRPEVRKVFVCHPYTPVYYLRVPYTVAFGRFREQPHDGIRTVADAVRQTESLGITHVMDVNYFDSGYVWPERGAGELVFEGENVRVYSRQKATLE